MKILLSPSCKHLMSGAWLQDQITVSYFPDGEINMHITSDIKIGEDVWVIASVGSSQAIIELFMILDILESRGARIFLVLTYLSYLRNDKAEQYRFPFGDSILQLALQFNVEKIIVIHPHTMNIASEKIETDIWYDFFVECARDFDLLVAPDHGARSLVEAIGSITKKPTLFLEKRRNEHGQPFIESPITLNGERVLILDDMISTGATLIKAAELLAKAGASSIGAAATHGIFCNDALNALRQSAISKIVVTNSLYRAPDDQLIIRSIYPFILECINQAR